LGRIIGQQELLELRRRWGQEGKVVVFTNGCFDLLHVGHVRCLAQARQFGDVLVVGVNSDASARGIKGGKRPLVPEQERAEVVAALAAVDFVVLFGESTAEGLVADLCPEVYVKGGDYTGGSGKVAPEAEIVEGYGGKVVILPYLPGHSTSELIAAIVRGYRGHK